MGSNILLLLGDVHAAACGLQSKGCGPSMHPGNFFDTLRMFYRPAIWFRYFPQSRMKVRMFSFL